MAPNAPSNRAYAGPHDAAELQIADGTFATVVHRDLSDEDAETLGYSFDPDVPLASAVYAHRTITVSPELGAALDEAQYAPDPDAPDELSAVWPNVGGTASADNVIDVPETNPATRTVHVDDGSEEGIDLTPAEVNERARVASDAAGAIEEVRETQGDGNSPESVLAELVERRDAIDARLAQIDDALATLAESADADGLDDDEAALKHELDAEAERLRNERKPISDAIEQGA